MHRIAWNWIGIAGFGVALGAVVVMQQMRLVQRGRAAAELREAHAECERLRAQYQQLLNRTPSSEQLAGLRADRDALGRLRAEVSALREREHLPERPRGGMPQPAEPANELSRIVPAASWANRGRATPETVLETTLWAAASGELEVLAQSLLLEPEARRRAEEVLNRLPPDTRAKYATPERLVALLTAREIPLGSLQQIAGMNLANGDRLLRVRLQAPDGSTKTTSIAARGAAGDWRLVVPGSAVDRLALQLAH